MSFSVKQSNSTLDVDFRFFDFNPEDISIQWPAPTILSLIIFALSFLLGVPGNGAVIWVTGFKMKRNAQTVCFLNLAVADLIYCLILPFLVASYFVLRPWPQDKLLWMFRLCAINLNLSASIFLLTLISICRCLAVTRPIWFRLHLRLAWVRAACFVAWVLAFLMSLPHLLSEQIDLYVTDKTGVKLQVTWTVFTFGLPVVIMAACYLLITRELCREQFAQSRKSVRLIVTVVAAFIVCWLPNTVRGLLKAFSQPVHWKWMYFTFGLASFNSALNPLLYVFMGRGFRQVFRRSLATSLRLAFAEEGVTVEECPSDAHLRILSRSTSAEDGGGGSSAAPGGSPAGVSPRGSPPPLQREPGAESVPQSVQSTEQYSTGRGRSAHSA